MASTPEYSYGGSSPTPQSDHQPNDLISEETKYTFDKAQSYKIPPSSSRTPSPLPPAAQQHEWRRSSLRAHQTPEDYDITEIVPNRLFVMGTPSVDSSAFLNECFADHYLVWNLSDEPSHKVSKGLHVQICDFLWSTPGKSQTPCLDAVFKLCYSIHAYLALHPENAAFIFCTNGKTRTGIVLACYLRFSGQVTTALEGFRGFCEKRCTAPQEVIFSQILPSLVQYFHFFDQACTLQHFPNYDPLVLNSIRVDSVPVKDQPIIDIWDANNVKVYSSIDAVEENKDWGDETWLYRNVQASLLGDFVLICRFGGKYTNDSEDPSKILFRYVGNTAFLAEGPIEMDIKKVDMMKYAKSFEEETFMLELDFVEDTTDHRTLPDKVYLNNEATIEGLHEILSMHHCTPHPAHHQQILLKGYTREAATLALQLANNNVDRALGLLTHTLQPFLSFLSTRDITTHTQTHNKP